MATKIEFEAFKYLYEREHARYLELGNRAKIFLSLITLIFGSLFLKLDAILTIAGRHWSILLILIMTWLAFMGALICTLLSLFIRVYEGLNRPRRMADEIDETHPDEATFLDSRIADFTVATERNHKENESRASWLQRAGLALLLGFSLSFLFLLLAALFPAPGT